MNRNVERELYVSFYTGYVTVVLKRRTRDLVEGKVKKSVDRNPDIVNRGGRHEGDEKSKEGWL